MTIVSVIVPAYEAEAHVARAVRSALGQSLRDIEVLVVDDGSTDRTAEAALSAGNGDARLQVIRQPRNGGVSAARNAALRAARGCWIAPLDADDVFSDCDRLARLVASAERCAADIFADHVVLVRGDDPPARMFDVNERYERRPMDARCFVTLDSPTQPLGFMKPLLRRSFLDERELRYPDGIDVGEDFHLYVRCLLRGARLFWTRSASYAATARPGSLSRSDSDRTFATFARSTSLLREEALALRQGGAAVALGRRASDLRSYGAYNRLSDALHHRRFPEAVRVFCALSLRSYTWRRFGVAVRRRLMTQ